VTSPASQREVKELSFGNFTVQEWYRQQLIFLPGWSLKALDDQSLHMQG